MVTPSTPARALISLLEPLRGTQLPASDQIVLACQIATWVFLAHTNQLPPELVPEQAQWNGHDLARVFARLQQLDTLKGNGEAFALRTPVLATVPDQTIAQVLRQAQHLVQRDPNDIDLYTEVLASTQTYGQMGHSPLPAELVDLLIGLADLEAGDSVYTPFDSTLQLSLAAAKTGARPHAELPSISALPYLANLLDGQHVLISAGDPLLQPSYTDGPRLQKFKHSVTFAPLGKRVPLEVVARDPYHRFPERTNAGHVLAVRHVLAQTEERAIILTANSLLFGTGAERALREELVHRGLQTVIALPPATLFGSSIPLSILVVNQRHATADAKVLFVDGNDARFHQRDGKGRTTLSGWQDLLHAARTGKDPAAVRVSRDEISAIDYQLTVSRYARSEALDAVETALRQGEVTALEDLVEFIRPVPSIPSGTETQAGVEVLTVGATDLIEHDYIHRPEKTVRLTALKNTLKPLDILIIMKGSIGKVGLVPPSLSEPWVASQTCLVLRLLPGRQKSTGHTPRSLFLYLQSAVGKACLQRLFSGTAVPVIQLRELRKLPVLMPTAQQAKAADQVLEEIVALQREIDALRARQDTLAGGFWPLPPVDNSSFEGAS